VLQQPREGLVPTRPPARLLACSPWPASSSPSWWQRAASSRSCPHLWALALALLSSAERKENQGLNRALLSAPCPGYPRPEALTAEVALQVHAQTTARTSRVAQLPRPPPAQYKGPANPIAHA
jgi:hypothetical protein